jgi:cold shock CspA family protein
MIEVDIPLINEPIDFCRVKKIDEKGYGFLISQHYTSDVFFHFSQIKKEELLTKLAKLKRGDFFLFFTSKERPDGKRKVERLWYEVSEIPIEMIPSLIDILVKQFDEGKTNLYDLLFIFSELKKLNYLFPAVIESIICSKKILNLPTTILPYLNDDELKILFKNLNFSDLKNDPKKPFWYEEMDKLGIRYDVCPDGSGDV